MKKKSNNNFPNLRLILSTVTSLTLLATITLSSLANNAADSTISPIKNIERDNFLVITDIHLDVKNNRSMAINPMIYNSRNDLDQETFLKMVTAIKNGIKNREMAKPKFILLLGDIVSHGNAPSKDASSNELQVFKLLKNSFPSTPILYVFGNNDSLDGDYGNFTSNSKEHDSPYRIAKRSGWKNGFLSTGNICSADSDNHLPCIINENRKLGYYSSYIYPNLRLIALNSMPFFAKRADDQAKQDSEIELKWFANQLQKARNNGESVLIAMHIPPGNNILDHMDFWRDSPNRVFLENVKTYQDNIIGILAAHTHMEELKVIQDKSTKNAENTHETKNKNIDLILITAGLSTSHGNAPSVKTFYMLPQGDKWQLFDYTTFGFEQDKHENIFLKNIYNYRDKYCSKYQGPENSMLECLSSDNDNDIVANIMKYYTVKNPNFPGIIIAPGDTFIKFGSPSKCLGSII